jgi:hypothetical protein
MTLDSNSSVFEEDFCGGGKDKSIVRKCGEVDPWRDGRDLR